MCTPKPAMPLHISCIVIRIMWPAMPHVDSPDMLNLITAGPEFSCKYHGYRNAYGCPSIWAPSHGAPTWWPTRCQETEEGRTRAGARGGVPSEVSWSFKDVTLCQNCLLVAYDWTTCPLNGSCLAIGGILIASSGTFTAQPLMIMCSCLHSY